MCSNIISGVRFGRNQTLNAIEMSMMLPLVLVFWTIDTIQWEFSLIMWSTPTSNHLFWNYCYLASYFQLLTFAVDYFLRVPCCICCSGFYFVITCSSFIFNKITMNKSLGGFATSYSFVTSLNFATSYVLPTPAKRQCIWIKLPPYNVPNYVIMLSWSNLGEREPLTPVEGRHIVELRLCGKTEIL